MANFFEQFHTPPARTTPQAAPQAAPPSSGGGSNFFEQFHQPARAPQQSVPSPIVPPSGDRAPLQITVRPENAGTAEAGQPAAPQPTDTPPQTPFGARMLLDFRNQGSAASQLTTPDIASHEPNLLSTEVHEDELGQVVFRDPRSGQWIPTDRNEHVVLRDPANQQVKVFARTADTDEGRLSSGGRILGTGFAAGAPTIRPSLAGPAAIPRQRPNQPVIEAATRLDANLPRAVSTDSMMTQRAAAVGRNIPGAGDPLIRATDRTINTLGQRADEVASSFGGGTAHGSGEAARSGIKNWITGTSAANAEKLYDKVDDFVNPVVTTPLRHTSAATQKIEAARNMAGLPPDGSGAINHVATALARPEGLTYEGVKTLRKSVREMLKHRLLPANISQEELEGIYKALSLDLRESVKAAGGDKALAVFERANQHYSLISRRREELAKIVGAKGEVPAEQVFDRLVAMAGSTARADINKLAQARKAIGADDWNEFVSGVVTRLGRSPAAQGGPEALQVADFSPQRFLTSYGKLSPAGKNVLFRSTGQGDLAKVLDDIATVSTRFKEMQRFSNPSGTSQVVFGGSVLAGLWAEPLTTISLVIGGRAISHMLSQPAKAASVRDWSQSYTRAARQPTASSIANLNLASRNLLNNLGNGFGSFTPADFLRTIQGPMRAAAEDEQR